MNSLKKYDDSKINSLIKSQSEHNLDENDTEIKNKFNIKPEFCSVDDDGCKWNYKIAKDDDSMSDDDIEKNQIKSKRLILVCEFCGKQFQKSAELNRHKRLHTGEKPYKCKYYEKRFSCNANCIVHERVHTGEKRYHCDKCDKKYTNATSLRSHKRRHAGVVSHLCDLCNKYFATYMHLVRHKELCEPQGNKK